MNLIELHKKLIAAARAQRPSEQVPYAFEKRIMARLVSQPVADVWMAWSRGLWRAAAPCLAVMMLLGVWNYLTIDQNPPKSTNLSQDFENTMFAAVDQDNNNNSW